MATSLKLAEVNDRELLLILRDETEASGGWAEPQKIADRLRLDHPWPLRCVVSRFAWMTRWGIVERDHENRTYRLSDYGESMVMGRLTGRNAQALDNIDDRFLLDVMSHITGRYRRMNPTYAHLVRREWQHGTHRARLLA